MTVTYQVPRYPAIRFFIARGASIAALLLIACAAAGLYAAWQFGLWLALPAGIVVGALLAGLMLSFVELLRIVAETLMPR